MSKASRPSDFAGGSRWRSPSWGGPRRKRAPAGLPPARRTTSFNDTDYGRWQFKTFADAKADDPALFAAWFETPQLVRFPGGESLQDLAARVANALRFVLTRHTSDTIVIVGHDSVNRALLLQLLDLPLSAYWRFEQSPCCLNEIDVEGGNVWVRRINETRHLEEAATA